MCDHQLVLLFNGKVHRCIFAIYFNILFQFLIPLNHLVKYGNNKKEAGTKVKNESQCYLKMN